jgi:hypothetical protein
MAMLPFIFMSSRDSDPEWALQSALATAAAAECADTQRRNTLGRVAYLLCEVAWQYRRQTGDATGAVEVSRAELARVLGVSVSRVKRILALLALSEVIRVGDSSLQVLDWRRLCSVGGYDLARLGLAPEAEEDEADAAEERVEAAHLVTSTGDPACFV